MASVVQKYMKAFRLYGWKDTLAKMYSVRVYVYLYNHVCLIHLPPCHDSKQAMSLAPCGRASEPTRGRRPSDRSSLETHTHTLPLTHPQYQNPDPPPYTHTHPTPTHGTKILTPPSPYAHADRWAR